MMITLSPGKIILYLLAAIMLGAWQTTLAQTNTQEVRIGVTAFRSIVHTRNQWQATADYLNKTIPGYHFNIVALKLDELNEAAKRGQIEFILTNPEHYVLLRSEYGLTAIATLINFTEGRPVSSFGGTIFTLAQHAEINTLQDLRGKKIAAVHNKSFAGFLMQRWTLFKNDIEINEIGTINYVGQPQDKVVMAVLNGEADAGFVRTGVLESMAVENKLRLEQIKVLNLQPNETFPQLLSTDLFPEWPLSASKNVPETLIKSVAQQLLNIKREDQAALTGEYYGFTPPGDYSSVEAVMLKLHAIPNQNADFNWYDIYQKYSLSISAGLIVFLLSMLAAAIHLWRNNLYLRGAYAERDQLALNLRMANNTLESKVEQRTRQFRDSQTSLQLMLDSMSEAMYGIDINGNCTFVNAAFLRTLGYPNDDDIIGENIHQLIHHSRADGSPYPAAECNILKAFKLNQPTHADNEEFWRSDGSSLAVEYWAHPTISNGVVVGAVATFQDITERKLAQQQIQQLAFYDPLTSLPNRRLLQDRLGQALAVSERNLHHGAVLFLDLDNFKSLNDTKGHEIGDQLLIEVARRLESCLREGDTVARLGGDEFVVVLEILSLNYAEAATQAELVGEKIRTELNRPYQLKEHSHNTTPSIGIVLFNGHKDSIDDLLKFADIAMYQAKTAGRNAIRFYDPDMQVAIEQRIGMETELRNAIEQQQFCLYYQIQVDSQRRALGAEVLLRWQHPQRGLVSPLHFIPIAEETGLILPLGLWVLKQACAQLKLWQQNPLTRDLTLAINVCSLQFNQANFVDEVKSVLLECGADPCKLKMEMTESMVLKNVEDVICKMNELKALGLSFSLDDFGTGYSSLQYLKRLPLDQIKIDQSFVRDINIDSNDDAIVQTIIAMTQVLGFNVIAEGVETEDQQIFLEQCGCHAFQGYLFSRPVPIAEFEASLKITTN